MSYLNEQYEVLKKHFSETYLDRQIADGYNGKGVYAYVIKRKGLTRIFVAKDSQRYDGVVSIHLELVKNSAKAGIPIIMSLKGTFYIIHPANILSARYEVNTHNNAEMANFQLGDVKAEVIQLPGEINSINTILPKTEKQFKLLLESAK